MTTYNRYQTGIPVSDRYTGLIPVSGTGTGIPVRKKMNRYRYTGIAKTRTGTGTGTQKSNRYASSSLERGRERLESWSSGVWRLDTGHWTLSGLWTLDSGLLSLDLDSL